MWTAIWRPSRSSSTPLPERRLAEGAWGTAHRPLLGIATLVGALAILPGMDAIAKHLSGHLPVLEIAWASWLAPRRAAAARRGRASQATAMHADFVHLRTVRVSSFRGISTRPVGSGAAGTNCGKEAQLRG